jgi:hypothetical protein
MFFLLIDDPPELLWYGFSSAGVVTFESLARTEFLISAATQLRTFHIALSRACAASINAP